MTMSLEGIRVIDASRVLAGPMCGQMLADHGAEVIKVEPPRGDETRYWGPPFFREDHSAYFTGLNRNKANVSLDLRTPGGQAVLRRMLAGADVLLENFKAGTLAAWGLDDTTIADEFPHLVHCRITGYGTDGPLGGAPGYDAVIQANSGLMSINGEAEGPEMRIGIPLVDIVTSLNAMAGVLMALRARDTTGRGQLLDMALLDSALAILHPHAYTYLASGADPVRTGVAHPTIAPYETFAAADGPLFLAVGNDGQYRRALEVLGAEGEAAGERFATNPDRVRNRAQLREVLGPLIARRGREELAEAMLAAGVPAGAVNRVSEALAHPQVRHRGMVVEEDGYRGIGIPIKLTGTPGRVRFGPRDRGADNRAVLAGLGLDEAEIAELERTGVLGATTAGTVGD
ncbi:carnitine dehydratase [Corynebacterium sphenisci DSM 44792]|uniref:Carnitine dehydratase n=1 Tax=Corynebacterium sphenisci DSM 44792 TaxID=1437874 RepID=A0A1L7CYM9_9CORY|nr:CoA transferase [Corynebacterium sphenisci]APT90932.1 carnitine dehydratase [Corynebacterium sphenisci DSM 44792]